MSKNRLKPLQKYAKKKPGPDNNPYCAHIVTPERAKLGPDKNFIYIYIYKSCEVIIWAEFGLFRCYYLGQVGVIIWAKLFLAHKNSGFKRFFAHTVII